MPIIFQDLLLGVLVLGGHEAFRFSPDDRELLEIFVSQSAAAIAKARLFQDIQDRRQLTEDLYALTQAMDRSMDLQERVEIFAASANRALSFDRLNVWLSEDDGATLRLMAGSDVGPGVQRLIPLRGSGGLQVVWDSGITLMVSSDEQLAQVPAAARRSSTPTRCCARGASPSCRSSSRAGRSGSSAPTTRRAAGPSRGGASPTSSSSASSSPPRSTTRASTARPASARRTPPFSWRSPASSPPP